MISQLRDHRDLDVQHPQEEEVGLAEEPRNYAHTREMIKYLWINYIE